MMVLAAIARRATLTGVVEVWMIIVLALLLGTANAIDMPVRQSSWSRSGAATSATRSPSTRRCSTRRVSSARPLPA